MNLPTIILASASPRRSLLLGEQGVPFTVVPSDAEEIHDENLTATELCQVNACRKARAVAKQHPDCLVVGADTLVTLGTRLYGKPADMAEAERMLSELQGQTHQVVTGVCLVQARAHRQRVFAELTDVTFRPLDAAQIRRYLQAVPTLDKAGAYAIQESGEKIISEISGSYSNVVGLPVERLREELQAWNRE